MNTDLKPISYDNLRDEVDNIVSSARRLKTSMAMSLIRHTELNQFARQEYETAVESFVAFWTDYSEVLGNKIKSSHGKEGVYTLELDVIRDIIYSKHDYNSILLFADGVLKGITSGRFESPGDIDDFRDHTIGKAFDGFPGSTIDILNSFNVYGTGAMITYKTTDKADAAKYNSIRTYSGLFNRRTGSEMYQAIVKSVNTTMRYIKENGIGNTVHSRNIVSSVINNVIDYASYTLAAYAARILMISLYAVPFIMSSAGDSDVHTEDTKIEMHDDGEIFTGNGVLNVMKDVNDIEYRDIRNVRQLIAKFEEFVKTFGAPGKDIGPISRNFVSRDLIRNNNPLGDQLVDNTLFMIIDSHRYDYIGGMNDRDIAELHHTLKDSVYNAAHGRSDSSSDKQALLHVIKGVNVDDKTLADYQKTVDALSAFAIYMCSRIASIAEITVKWYAREADGPQFDIGSKAIAKECIKMLEDLYKDVSGALIFRARDLEMKINASKEDQVAKAFKSIEIKIPGEIDDKVQTIHNMMSAVPDTTRAPANMIVDDTPTFEYLMLRDMFLKDLPLFESVMYYSEAYSFDDLLNQLMSLLSGGLKRIQGYRDDHKVKAASAWVTRHEADIRAINTSALKMDINNYKSTVTLPDGFNNFQSNLGQFDEKDLENHDTMEAFIKSLYPNDIIYGWFNTKDETKKKDAAAKYKNLLLYYPDPERSQPEPPAMISVSGSDLSARLNDAVDTLKSIQQTYTTFESMFKDIMQSVNTMKGKVSRMAAEKKINDASKPASAEQKSGDAAHTEATNNSTNEGEGEGSPPDGKVEVKDQSTTEGNEEESKTTGDETAETEKGKEDATVESKGQILMTVIADVTSAFRNLVEPIHLAMIEYVTSQYKWIKNIYNSANH